MYLPALPPRRLLPGAGASEIHFCVSSIIYPNTLTQQHVSDLAATLAALESEHISHWERIVTFWSPPTNEESHVFTNAGWQCDLQKRPDLHVDANSSSFTLPEIEWRKKQTSQRSLRKNILILSSVVLCLLLFIWAGYLGWLQVQAQNLQAELKKLEPAARAVEMTATQWQSLKHALTPALSPIETLFRCTQSLEEKEIRLTKFEQVQETIMLQGEAVNPTRIFAYVEELKKSDDLKHCRWQDPDIKILAKGNARFTLEGTIFHAPTE